VRFGVLYPISDDRHSIAIAKKTGAYEKHNLQGCRDAFQNPARRSRGVEQLWRGQSSNSIWGARQRIPRVSTRGWSRAAARTSLAVVSGANSRTYEPCVEPQAAKPKSIDENPEAAAAKSRVSSLVFGSLGFSSGDICTPKRSSNWMPSVGASWGNRRGRQTCCRPLLTGQIDGFPSLRADHPTPRQS